MKAPQIIMIVMYTINLVCALILHGKPHTGRYNFWASAVGALSGIALLWWGGFWG